MNHNASILYHINRVAKEATKQMKINMPKGIITNQADFKILSNNKINYKEFMNLESKKNLCLFGCYHLDTDYLFINLKEIKYIPDIDHTLIHELTHKKFPKLKHGNKFDSIIEKIELKLSRCDHYFNNCRTLLNMGLKNQKFIDSKMCKNCYLEIRYNEINNKGVLINGS